MSVGVMWFRRDLRLGDNPALVEALSDLDEVVPLFVVDQRLWGPSGDNRRWFLAGALAALDHDMGGALVVRKGRPEHKVRALARDLGADQVYCAEDFGPYGRQRDDDVGAALASEGAELVRVGSPYAVPPGTIYNRSDEPYKVFTPFSKAWRAHGWDDPRRRPSKPAWASGVDSDGLPERPRVGADLPEPGEDAARRRLGGFLDRDVDQYANARNHLAEDATSRLSPYLKWGCIHPRQVLARLGDGRGPRTFVNELCWREFYADVLFHRPDSARRSYNRSMAAMKVDVGKDADRRFQAWCEGRTGYPIVDAAMRQLRAEGWMHNRARMIVASFLVKDLHVDWTRGARWFMDHLVDGDLASNQHGWQWTAGTGTDAAPYFRVFNPVTQGQKFDPDGDYIRRYVPELAGLGGAAVHQPWEQAGSLFGDLDYPEPIVDHQTEREEALARYQQVREQG